MPKSSGMLKYEKPYRVTVVVGLDLADYYRSLLPVDLKYNKPKYWPHITVVRDGYETPSPYNYGLWSGDLIDFEYSTNIQMDSEYIWLPVKCELLSKLRGELGLDWCYDKVKGFHITLGNFKGLEIGT